MRVISGRLKGRRLKSFKADHIRPTTDQVKEVIFNKLMFSIGEATVLDLFAGTGSLAIEAISRGATWVTLVESHKLSLKIIKENFNLLQILEGYDLIGKDVFAFLSQPTEKKYEIVLVDPPFTEKIADQVMEKLGTFQGLASECRIFIESSKHEVIKDAYGELKLLDRKDFGDKKLSIFYKG